MTRAAHAFRIVGGIDFSPNRDDKAALFQARARARPILKEWLIRVEHHIMAGALSPLDLMMARELTNYPSANEGRCYAGQERLGKAIGSCARTARSSLKRLCQAGLLTTKRGGPGRTSAWTFCINGRPIFSNKEDDEPKLKGKEFSAPDRKDVSGLDRQDVADKPSELKPIEHNPPPVAPPSPSPENAYRRRRRHREDCDGKKMIGTLDDLNAKLAEADWQQVADGRAGPLFRRQPPNAVHSLLPRTQIIWPDSDEWNAMLKYLEGRGEKRRISFMRTPACSSGYQVLTSELEQALRDFPQSEIICGQLRPSADTYPSTFTSEAALESECCNA